MKPVFMTYTKKDLINLAVCMILSVLIIPTFIKTEYFDPSRGFIYRPYFISTIRYFSNLTSLGGSSPAAELNLDSHPKRHQIPSKPKLLVSNAWP